MLQLTCNKIKDSVCKYYKNVDVTKNYFQMALIHSKLNIRILFTHTVLLSSCGNLKEDIAIWTCLKIPLKKDIYHNAKIKSLQGQGYFYVHLLCECVVLRQRETDFRTTFKNTFFYGIKKFRAFLPCCVAAEKSARKKLLDLYNLGLDHQQIY